MRKNPTYNTWASMLARVRGTSGYQDLHLYKNKGIGVCDRWLVYCNFLADMGERPKGMSIDRIDANKGYCKENCRWADCTTQARNRPGFVVLDFDKAVELTVRFHRGELRKNLAKEYGLSEGSVGDITRGRSWKDAYQKAKEILCINEEIRMGRKIIKSETIKEIIIESKKGATKKELCAKYSIHYEYMLLICSGKARKREYAEAMNALATSSQ